MCFYHASGTIVVMSSMSPATITIVIRRAVTGDTASLARLTALDSARPLSGEVLLAEADGHLRAALSLHDGRAIADPFRATVGDVALLRTRAALLQSPARSHAARRGLRARVRTARA